MYYERVRSSPDIDPDTSQKLADLYERYGLANLAKAIKQLSIKKEIVSIFENELFNINKFIGGSSNYGDPSENIYNWDLKKHIDDLNRLSNPALDVLGAAFCSGSASKKAEGIVMKLKLHKDRMAVYCYVMNELNGTKVGDVFIALRRGLVDPKLVEIFVRNGSFQNLHEADSVYSGYPDLRAEMLEKCDWYKNILENREKGLVVRII